MLDGHQVLEAMQGGLGPFAGSGALIVNRLFLGLFFAISGFHKLFNKGRHAHLIARLKASHIPLIGFNQWWVPAVEFLGGLALISGVLAPLAGLALVIECLVAVYAEGRKRIAAYRPIDKADWLDDLLYLQEMLAIVALLIVIGLGPGPLTLPDLLF